MREQRHELFKHLDELEWNLLEDLSHGGRPGLAMECAYAIEVVRGTVSKNALFHKSMQDLPKEAEAVYLNAMDLIETLRPTSPSADRISVAIFKLGESCGRLMARKKLGRTER